MEGKMVSLNFLGNPEISKKRNKQNQKEWLKNKYQDSRLEKTETESCPKFMTQKP